MIWFGTTKVLRPPPLPACDVDHILPNHSAFSDDGVQVYNNIATINGLRVADGWQPISGDFYMASAGGLIHSLNFSIHKIFTLQFIVEINNTRVWIKGSTPYLEYLVDTASLTAWRGNVLWRQESEARIEEIRKNDITIKYESKDDGF